MKRMYKTAKDNPWKTAITIVSLIGAPVAAKFGLFDQIMPSLKYLIQNQRVLIHMQDGKTLLKAEKFAEEDMIKFHYRKEHQGTH